MRIGHINFLNVLPLTYSYQHNRAADLSLTFDVPTALNDKIKHGLLDVSAISAIAFARQSRDLVMLPDICIRGDNDIESIVLVSRRPIDQLHDDKIILTSKSATAQCLLRIIMAERYNAAPDYETRHVEVDNPIPDDAAAAMLIGDDALYVYLRTPNDVYCYDLGRLWHDLTDRSMVYAVWAARRKFADQSPDQLQRAYNAIIDGMNDGLKNKSAAIQSILNKKPFTFEELDHYLGGIIKWDLTDEHLISLRTYYDLAYKHGLIDHVPTIEMANVNRKTIGVIDR